MRLRSAAIVALAVLAAPAAAAAPAAEAPAKLAIGLIPEVNIFKQKARFRPLGEYLGRTLGVGVQFTVLPHYLDVLDALEAGALDGAVLGSYTAAVAIARLGAIPLARPVNPDGTTSYQGNLFVRGDSGIRALADMRGKRMVFVDPGTAAGYLFPLAWLREQGVASPERFFGECFYAGSHDAAVDAVLSGAADVGAAKDSVLARMRAADPRVAGELVVLARSPSVPSNALVVRPDLAPAVAEGLRRALLALAADGEGAAVLARLDALSFVEAAAEDYAPVVALAHRAGVDLRRPPGPASASARGSERGAR